MEFIQIGSMQYNAAAVQVEKIASGVRVHLGNGKRDFDLDESVRDALMDSLPEGCVYKSGRKSKATADDSE